MFKIKTKLQHLGMLASFALTFTAAMSLGFSPAFAIDAGTTNVLVEDGDISLTGPPNVTTLTTNGIILGAGTSPLTATAACTTANFVLRAGSPPACGALVDGDVPDTITVDNAATADALSADPADCTANQFATTIAASGALTCAAIGDADVPNGITIDLAATATALAADPADCSANEFATTIAASGALTCAAIGDADVPDTITATNYCALAGEGACTMTGTIIADNLGIEFPASDTNPTCAASDYLIYADLSETTLKKCVNGVLSDLDTAGAGITPLIGFGSGTKVKSASTVYVWPGLVDSVLSHVEAPVDQGGTFLNMNCQVSTAPGGSDTVTVTLGDGTCGAIAWTTQLECQVSAAGTTCDSGASTTVTSAGECLAMRVVSSATAADSWVSCTFEKTA